MRNRHFDRQGRPISFEEWGPKFEDKEYRVVDHTLFTDGSYVSTIWLGLDHGAGGALLIFETMAFGAPNGSDGPQDEEECSRSGTEEKARESHRQAVREHLLRHPELMKTAIEWWGRNVFPFEP